MRDAAALLVLPTNTCQRRRPSVPTVIETQVVADCTAAARGNERGGAMPKSKTVARSNGATSSPLGPGGVASHA